MVVDLITHCAGKLQIEAFALVAAEEVSFNVQMHRLPIKTIIRVDFNILSVRFEHFSVKLYAAQEGDAGN